MNAREEPREVAFLSECKGKARRMQQLGSQIAIHGYERPGGNQGCPGRPRKMRRGRSQRAVRDSGPGKHGDDYVLNCAKQRRYRHECREKGERSVASRIL